jgi:plastocyanin
MIISPAADAQLDTPQSTITGKVQIISKRKRAVAPMVIYLESTDPKKKFASPVKDIVVSQKGAKFSPSMIVVAQGQSIRYTNDEQRNIEHNVFSRSPSKSFDLGLYPPGEYKSVKFKRPGEIRLFCSIHRYMDGVIYVCPTPYFA